MTMVNEIRQELVNGIIPFWKGFRDDEYGGYYGYMDFDLNVDRKYERSCILNSRILWFFSSAYKVLEDVSLLDEAKHAYEFLLKYCLDKKDGGSFWSVTYNGAPLDTTKHTYNQAFTIYGLSAYYDVSGDEDALKLALSLYELIEKKMRDEDGYLEAFDREFKPVSNEKLSENGTEATRSMNTLLHVMEGYTELYRVSGDSRVRKSLYEVLDIVDKKIYNPKLHRQECFFDKEYNSLVNLYSYGHDIEAAWLINRTTDILCDPELSEKIGKITDDLVSAVYKVAFDGRSIPVEAENGIVKEDRVWWVQAEAINGFLDAYERHPEKKEYLNAAKALWDYIKEVIIDKREGSEWYWYVDAEGVPAKEPIVEPWKCPYHNGRMCLEVITRNVA